MAISDNAIGLTAVFDDSEFNKGIAAYNAAILDADSDTKTAAVSMENSINSMAKDVTQSFETVGKEVPPDLKKVTDAVKKAGDETKQTADKTKRDTADMAQSYQRLGDIARGVFAAIGVAIAGAAVATGAFMVSAVDQASDLNETISKTQTVFGDSAAAVLAFGDNAAFAIGTSKNAALSGAAVFGNLFRSMEMGEEMSANMSVELVQLAGDLASFNNLDPTEVLDKLRAGLTGETEPLKSLGVNISAATLEAKAMEMGLADATGELSASAKAQASYALIMEQTKLAQGDFAKTSSGVANQQRILAAVFSDIQAKIGTGLLPMLSALGQAITDYLARPETQATIDAIAKSVEDFGTMVAENIPAIISTIEGIPAWFEENEPIIVGVLAALGVAMLAFGIEAAAGLAPVVVAAAPLIAILAVIAGVVAIVYKAWTENWGGIQEKFAAAWEQIQPTFEQLQTWLGENIPIAIESLSRFWQETLLPAIQAVVGWLVDNVLPVLVDVVQWLGTNVPIAVTFLSDLWTNTLLPAIAQVSEFFTGTFLPAVSGVASWIGDVLIPAVGSVARSLSVTLGGAVRTAAAIWTTVLLPAITAIWNFINKNIIPLFQALSNLMNALVGVAIRAMAGLWQSVLLPALNSVWSFINKNIIPVFEAIGGVINGTVRPAISAFAGWLSTTALELFGPFSKWLSDVFLGAWKGIEGAIQAIIELLNNLTGALNNLELPDWLTPGSPTPLEMGILGINKQLTAMANATLPAVRYQLDVIGSVRDVQSMAGRSGGAVSNISNTNQSTNNYLFGARFSVENQSSLSAILQGSV